MKPEEYYKQMEKEDEDEPKDINDLKQEIIELYRKEKELLEKMPPHVHVSIFRIHCQEMVEKLAGKYSDTAKQLELLITKKAKKMTKAMQ
jgi:hypothetical protein